jgi:hypothetical protein
MRKSNPLIAFPRLVDDILTFAHSTKQIGYHKTEDFEVDYLSGDYFIHDESIGQSEYRITKKGALWLRSYIEYVAQRE